MTRNWIVTVVLAGGLEAAIFGQQYPKQYPQQYPQQQYPQQQYAQQNAPYQGDPNNYGQYDNRPYNDQGQYAEDQGYGPGGDPGYNANAEGVYAPAPPPPPAYAYQRPPEPGPGYYWVDGYWNFLGGRYTWANGYWARPPYAGAYWVAPRYSGRRFFVGFWGGGRSHYSGRYYAPRYSYRAPAVSRHGFRGGDYHQGRSEYREHRGRRW